MDLSRHFILLNGEAKTLQIDSIRRTESNCFCVRFKNNPKPYTYSADKVVWLSNPEWVEADESKVYIDGIQVSNVRQLWKFVHNGKEYWRVVHTSGYMLDDALGRVQVATSCLSEQRARDTFAYLKDVATTNPLGSEETGRGILANLYEKVDHIDSNTAAACYLNPNRHHPKPLRHSDLIYPFGCNASQKKAVETAFERQMSVIQGPPGTGKTQTILNIIANIVCQGKTVMVVSSNNSATSNMQEKLKKYGLEFIVAALGSLENKEAFIASQPSVPESCKGWILTQADSITLQRRLQATLLQLDSVFALQNKLAQLRQQQQSLALEWKHFCMDNGVDEHAQPSHRANSQSIIALWLACQAMADDRHLRSTSWPARAFLYLKWIWTKWNCRYRMHIRAKFSRNDLTPLICELQKLYYLNLQHELLKQAEDTKAKLSNYDAKQLTKLSDDLSMTLFKSWLGKYYSCHPRTAFQSVANFGHSGEVLREQYPVVLSTTFSARLCMFGDQPYDYLIMDEASQVSIETGCLALTCAYNAVIVGDTMQLPNVVTDEDRQKLNAIMERYQIPNGYDSAKNSFLQSVHEVVDDAPQNKLLEHYRCHPRIINFCSQKFYGGQLLIMTEDHGEEDVLCAIKTVVGNHCTHHCNQREIDVVKESLLPILQQYGSLGIITPYNHQVEAFHKQLPGIEAATIHKYQGREKDAIIFSVVDNQISDFADDANLLNVAVSRAKSKFCLVLTGNPQQHHGNIMDLLDYIAYNNCTVTESKLASIFDCLYAQYTTQRIAFLKTNPKISEYDSENLTYSMLLDVLKSQPRFGSLGVLCHIPLRQVIRDTSLMSAQEQRYAANFNTHLDFLIINRVGKQPVLAVETDGYSFHHDATEQHRRDLMKDHILSVYGLPLLRLSTKGSNEHEKVQAELERLV